MVRRIASPELLPDVWSLPHLIAPRAGLAAGARMRRVGMATRDELLAAVAARYRDSRRAEKTRILDEFAAVTGHHRKHAMRLLRAGPSDREPASRVP